MGKAGLIGQKIAATLASTGTRSHFLHPGEAIHGDLGRRARRRRGADALVQRPDRRSRTRLLPPIAELGVPIVAMTGQLEQPARPGGRRDARSGRRFARPARSGWRRAASTTAMLALGRRAGPRPQPHASTSRRRLRPVSSGRQPGAEAGPRRRSDAAAGRLPPGARRQSVRDALVAESRPGRRTGAIMVVDEAGRLVGIFTDSDLARLLEAQPRRRDRWPDRRRDDRSARRPSPSARGCPPRAKYSPHEEDQRAARGRCRRTSRSG